MRSTLLLTAALLTAAAALAGELPAGWAGRTACADCHDEDVTAFTTGPHGRLMADRGGRLNLLELSGETLERACESCHGPGAAHVEDPTSENINGLRGSTADASAGCITCHAAQAGGLSLRTDAHRRADVACLDCHVSGHAEPAAEPLLARERGALCTPCHGSQAARLRLPSAHREGATPFECMSCHTVHGGITANGRVVEDGRPVCVTCHSEKAGPFVFPHPPREVEGCITCHRPHGSPNPKMLTRSDVTQLCLECHTDTPRFHNLAEPAFRVCQSCHSAVHGSQRDPRLFQE